MTRPDLNKPDRTEPGLDDADLSGAETTHLGLGEGSDMTAPGTVRPDAVHALDAISLVAGLVCALIAGLYLLADLTNAEVGPGLVTAAVVAALGAVGLLVGIRRLHRP